MAEEKFWQRIKKEFKYLFRPNWNLKEVGEHWDQTLHYDEINKETYSYFRRFTDAFKICSLKNRSYILDICSRTGNGTLYFWQKNKVSKAVCADVSPRMQKICAQRLSEAGVSFQTKLFQELPLPFSDQQFDNILCFETVEHFPQPEKFIKEISRVVKKGGEVIITTPNIAWEPVHSIAAIFGFHHSEGPHRFISRRKLHKFMERAGLKIIKEETTVLVPAGPKVLIRFGKWFEKKFKHSLMPLLGLRRIFICKKG